MQKVVASLLLLALGTGCRAGVFLDLSNAGGERVEFEEGILLQYMSGDVVQEAFFLSSTAGYCERTRNLLAESSELTEELQAALDGAENAQQECAAVDRYYAGLASLAGWRADGVRHAGLPSGPSSTRGLGYFAIFEIEPYSIARTLLDCENPGFVDESEVLDAATSKFVDLSVEHLQSDGATMISGEVLSTEGAAIGVFEASVRDPLDCSLDVEVAPWLSLY